MYGNEESLNLTTVILMNDDKSLSLTISFFGFKQNAIEKYLNEHFVECKKPYAQKYVQMKWMQELAQY